MVRELWSLVFFFFFLFFVFVFVFVFRVNGGCQGQFLMLFLLIKWLSTYQIKKKIRAATFECWFYTFFPFKVLDKTQKRFNFHILNNLSNFPLWRYDLCSLNSRTLLLHLVGYNYHKMFCMNNDDNSLVYYLIIVYTDGTFLKMLLWKCILDGKLYFLCYAYTTQLQLFDILTRVV